MLFLKTLKTPNILTGNNLGLIKTLPSVEEVEVFSKTDEMEEILEGSISSQNRTKYLQLFAKTVTMDIHLSGYRIDRYVFISFNFYKFLLIFSKPYIYPT